MKQALASQVAEGRLIVNYAGHGSTQVWGEHSDLLNPDDINGWSNSRLPFVIAMNCLNGLFQGIYDEEEPGRNAAARARRRRGGGLGLVRRHEYRHAGSDDPGAVPADLPGRPVHAG